LQLRCRGAPMDAPLCRSVHIAINEKRARRYNDAPLIALFVQGSAQRIGRLSTPARAEVSDQAETAEAAARYSLGQLLAYFLKLGSLGFGGPVALVGYMHRDLVENRRWISEADFREGLALAQIAPGPLAAQLAIYLGYVRYRILGATLVGLAFVLPSFVMVVALGWAYQLYGGLSWMQAVFYGVGASVIGIIALSAYKLTRKTVATDWLLW